MGSRLIDPNRRPLGTEFQVGPLAVGCWRFVARPDRELKAVLETGLELGMNLVDTADIYGLGWGGKAFGEAEENLGRILAAAPHLRDQMVLATKGGIVPGVPYNSGTTGITAACEAPLRRLRTDVMRDNPQITPITEDMDPFDAFDAFEHRRLDSPARDAVSVPAESTVVLATDHH